MPSTPTMRRSATASTGSARARIEADRARQPPTVAAPRPPVCAGPPSSRTSACARRAASTAPSQRVRAGLVRLDRQGQRDIICNVLRRIEIDGDRIEVAAPHEPLVPRIWAAPASSSGSRLWTQHWRWTQAGANLSPARALPCIQGKQQGNHRSERVLRKRRPEFERGLNGLPLQFPAQPSREINRRCTKCNARSSATTGNSRCRALPVNEGPHGLANALSDLTFDLVLPLSV